MVSDIALCNSNALLVVKTVVQWIVKFVVYLSAFSVTLL